MWLVSPSLLETFILGSVEIVLQNGLVVRVRTLLDDQSSTLRGETTDVC
jgi:hypothetical protein